MVACLPQWRGFYLYLLLLDQLLVLLESH